MHPYDARMQDARTFADALTAYAANLRDEDRLSVEHGFGPSRDLIADELGRCRRARAIHAAALSAAEAQAAAEMRAAGLDQYADALESGEWAAHLAL